MTELHRIQRLERAVSDVARILSKLPWGDDDTRKLLLLIEAELSQKTTASQAQ